MSVRLDELAATIAAEVRGDGSLQITACAGLEDAGPDHVSFLANSRYIKLLAKTKAGAVIVSPKDAEGDGAAAPGRTLLVAADPYFAFRQAVVALHGYRRQPSPQVNEQAIIDPTAVIGPDCSIAPFVYIAAGAKIGARCVLYPHCYVGPNATIGDDCILYPNVTVYDDCVLGNRVTLQAGCVIGQDGFGYATHALPGEPPRHHKIPQVGNVIVEDDVEMGANCAIDRATVGSTIIGNGTKFSDLVAIGHGTKVGEHNLLVAQVGLAGSVETGKYVVMGGQAGVAGHLKIGDLAQLAAKTGVAQDIPAGKEAWGGQPAMPLSLAKRNALIAMTLPDFVKDVRRMKKRLEELEAQVARLQGGEQESSRAQEQQSSKSK